MRKMRIVCGMFLAAVAACSSAAFGAHNWQKVDLREIKVRGEIGRRVDLAIYGNLLKIEIEKQFLEHFRQKALDDDSVGTGKLVEYAVRFAAYTRDPKVVALKNYVVDELLKTQDADGYIGCLCKKARLWGYWDLAETGFIILGLSADHHYFGEKRSLAAAERAAQFIIDNWKTMPEGWETAWISGTAAAVGLCWGMEALYRETGDRRYLDFCTRERKLDTWYAPITIGRGFGIHGHSATHLYQCIVQLEFLDRPTPTLRRAADETAAFMLDGDGTLISGACGLWECWTNDQSGRPSSGETCSTAFQIRFWDLLVQCSETTPSARWGDALERTMYNALFAAQSKDGRKVRYYAPLEGRRIYWPRDTYCCPNNFRRIMSELPEYLFYKSGDVLFANLYSECDLETELAGAKVRVEERTAYPSDGRIEFTLRPDRPGKFGFAVRVPGWCENPSLVADGERVDVKPGTVATIRREWKPGSKVVLELPMRLKAIAGRQRQSGRAAFLRGPVLYALNPVLNAGGKLVEAEAKSHVKTAEEQRAANLVKFFSKDPADYCGEMIVDATTAKVVPDDSARPGGTAVEVRAATVGHAVGVTDQNGSTIRLTEYPDCDANATYFRLLDQSVAVPDTLFTGNGR